MALPTPEQIEALTAAGETLGRERHALNGWAPEAMQRLERLAGSIERARDTATREAPRIAMGVAQLAGELRRLSEETGGAEGGVLSRIVAALGG